MELSVIIVNYNVKYFLEQCLCSVRKAVTGIEAEIIVVDNASTDGSCPYLEPLFPEVLFIWNEDNPGFAKACNQGFAASKGRHILFLNPDTLVPEDCFHTCITFLREHPDAGALGVRMLDGQGRFLPESKRSFPSPIISLYKLSGLSSLFPRSKTFGRYHLGHLDEHQDHVVDVLAGAFMMIRREVVDQTKGFDPTFFMYGEDVDLSYRIRQLQQLGSDQFYNNYYVSRTSIIHFKGESTRKGSLNYVRLFYLAMSQFVQKHATISGSKWFMLLIKIAIWFRAFISLLRQFVRNAALPFLDASIIYGMFWLSKDLWIRYVKPDMLYSETLLRFSFAGFSFLFLLVSYYTNLYQKKFRFSQLFYSSAISLLILLSAYSLLPETIRFSRGIVLTGSVFSFFALFVWRWLLLRIRFLEKAEDVERLYTLVVGTETDKKTVTNLTAKAKPTPQIRGWISTKAEPDALGNKEELDAVLKSTPARQLVLCEGSSYSYKEIISCFEQHGRTLQLRVHSAGSHSIIGSDSKEYAGEVIGATSYRLEQDAYKRLKRLADIAMAVVLLLGFPLHFFFHRKPFQLLLQCMQVLVRRKTWIGYSGEATGLPKLLPSVLGPAGLAHRNNNLSPEGRREANDWYAQEYDVMYDLITVFSHYKQLGMG